MLRHFQNYLKFNITDKIYKKIENFLNIFINNMTKKIPKSFLKLKKHIF